MKMALPLPRSSSDKIKLLESELAESRSHVQELQEMLAEEQSSQHEWRNYAESKNLEALAALECVDTLKQEQRVMEEYISDIETENAALREYMDRMQEQAVAQSGTQSPEFQTPRRQTPSPLSTSIDRSASLGKILLHASSIQPSTPAMEELKRQVAEYQEQVQQLQSQLQESQQNVNFLRKQLEHQNDQASTKQETGKYRQSLVNLETTLHVATSSPPSAQGHSNASTVDLNLIRGELWKYVSVLEEEKAQLISEVEELQASWVAAEGRCTVLQMKMDELEAALNEATAKEDLLQKTNRRLEAVLTVVSRENDGDSDGSSSSSGENFSHSSPEPTATSKPRPLTPLSAHRISVSESLPGDWQTPQPSPSIPRRSDPDLDALTQEIEIRFGGIASAAQAMMASVSKDSCSSPSTSQAGSDSCGREAGSLSTPDLLKDKSPIRKESVGVVKQNLGRRLMHADGEVVLLKAQGM